MRKWKKTMLATAVCAMIAVQPAWASSAVITVGQGVTTGTSAEAQGEVSLGNTPESSESTGSMSEQASVGSAPQEQTTSRVITMGESTKSEDTQTDEVQSEATQEEQAVSETVSAS